MLAPPHRPILALATLLTALAVAPGAAHAAGATVVKVVDGDTVRVKANGRTRSVNLRGVDAPEKADCYGSEATQALKRLLPRGARVTLRNGSIRRGRKLVNEALVRSGDARATGGQLTAAQDAARTAGRGLWAACPAPQPPGSGTPGGGTPPPPDVITGDAAIQRARTDLQGRRFTRIRTPSSFSSSESRLHLCSDGSFYEQVWTYSDFGGTTYGEYRGRWEVIAAEYRTGFAGARVRRANNDGSEGFLDIVAQGGRITTNGEAASADVSDACA
jgi:micrococcal nuclease